MFFFLLFLSFASLLVARRILSSLLNLNFHFDFLSWGNIFLEFFFSGNSRTNITCKFSQLDPLLIIQNVKKKIPRKSDNLSTLSEDVEMFKEIVLSQTSIQSSARLSSSLHRTPPKIFIFFFFFVFFCLNISFTLNFMWCEILRRFFSFVVAMRKFFFFVFFFACFCAHTSLILINVVFASRQ